MGLGTVVRIGWRAAESLAGGAPEIRVLAPVGASIYMVAAGEILWLTGLSDVMHSRAVVLSEPPDAAAYAVGDVISVPPWPMPAWRPAAPVSIERALARARLATMAESLGAPEGFGVWLTGGSLTFPLAGAGKAADALAAACARDDAVATTDAALALLGLGAGLTPSGDDFVGGAFFARAARCGTDNAAWKQARATVRAAAREATNPISAALLGDLMDGDGWSPLHDLSSALASDDHSHALSAARRLARLGHSSGWDLLAGFAAGASR